MTASQILFWTIEIIDQIHGLLHAFKMAQFYLTIFAESFKLSKTIFYLRKVVKIELFKRLELYNINAVKEVLDITLIAQNVFKVKVF